MQRSFFEDDRVVAHLLHEITADPNDSQKIWEQVDMGGMVKQALQQFSSNGSRFALLRAIGPGMQHRYGGASRPFCLFSRSWKHRLQCNKKHEVRAFIAPTSQPHYTTLTLC